MKFFVKLKTSGSDLKIVQVEALQDSITTDPSKGEYIYESEDDANINKLVNDFSKVKAFVAGGSLSLTFEDASAETTARTVPASQWMNRTRPALMRAATTVGLFNA